MLTKIKTHKIKYQPNIRTFVWNYYYLIKINAKQIIKTNSNSMKYWKVEIEKKKPNKTQSKKIKLKDRIKKRKKRDNTFNIHMNN
jgi:hypothetical protein